MNELEEFDPYDQMIIRMIALFCASTAMSGRQHSTSGEILQLTKKFEEYLVEEVK